MSSPPPQPDEPSSRGDLPPLFTLAFIVWCFVVGTLLLYAPWMPVWARWTASFTDPAVQQLLAHPTLRGAVCGFGLFHLVWGTHDLDGLIARFLRRQVARAEARSEAREAASRRDGGERVDEGREETEAEPEMEPVSETGPVVEEPDAAAGAETGDAREGRQVEVGSSRL